jgi:heme/copper-type cytochrome/quinol oxidase subunit 2
MEKHNELLRDLLDEKVTKQYSTGPAKTFETNDPEEKIITAIFIIVYVIIVCIVLFGLTMAVIYCIRKRRREALSRALMQARANEVPGIPHFSHNYNALPEPIIDSYGVPET